MNLQYLFTRVSLALLAALVFSGTASAQYPGWQHSGSLYLVTTPEGANLPASATETNFPLLVRLNKDFFNFSEAKAGGADLRFSSSTGSPLPCQIEQWDAANGTANVWVLIPQIKGNDRQEIKLHWGKADAASESKGSAVFTSANGFASVLHMDGALRDELDSLMPKDQGTTTSAGLIGEARHLTRGQGILGGAHVTNYPFGDGAFTSEAWFRPELAGTTIFYWGRYATRLNGKTGDGNEVGLNIGAPASPRQNRRNHAVPIGCEHHAALEQRRHLAGALEEHNVVATGQCRSDAELHRLDVLSVAALADDHRGASARA